MAGRFPGWHRRSGDVDASPALRDAGRKLLGYLETMNQHNPVDYRTAHRELPDGSVVEAILSHGVGSVRLLKGPSVGPQAVPKAFITGLVIKPRRVGTAAANDGDNAFGSSAARLINGRYVENDLSAWASVSAARVGTNRERKSVFPDGINAAGYPGGTQPGHAADWHDRNQVVCLTWSGRYVFRNGQVIATLPTGWNARAAAIQAAEQGPTLIVLATQGSTVRLYSGILTKHPDASRLVPPGVPLSLHPYWFPLTTEPDEDDFVSFTQLGADLSTASANDTIAGAFNQSGTECRYLRHALETVYALPGVTDPDLATFGDTVRRIYEYVVDLTDLTLAAMPVTVVDHGLTGVYRISSLPARTVRLSQSNRIYFGSEETHGPEPIADGSYPRTILTYYEHVEPTFYSPAYGMGSHPELFVTDQTNVQSFVPLSLEPVPLVVDYQDDVPVYLKAQYLGPFTITTTHAGDWSQSPTAAQTITDIAEGGSVVDSTSTYSASDTISSSYDANCSGSFPGIYYFADDKDGVRWFEDTLGAGSTTGALSLSASGSYSSAGNEDEVLCDASFTISRTSSRADSCEITRFYYVDLKSRSIGLCVETITDTGSLDVSGPSGSYAGAVFDTSVYGGRMNCNPVTYNTNSITTTRADITQSTFTSRLYAHGALVREYQVALPPVNTNSTTAGASSTATTDELTKFIMARPIVLTISDVAGLFPTIGPAATALGHSMIAANLGVEQGGYPEAASLFASLDGALDTETYFDVSATGGVLSAGTVGWRTYRLSSEAGDTFPVMGHHTAPARPARHYVGMAGASSPTPDTENTDPGGFGSYFPQFASRRDCWGYCLPDYRNPTSLSQNAVTFTVTSSAWLAEGSAENPSFPDDYDPDSARSFLEEAVCGVATAQLIGKLWPFSDCYYGQQAP